MTKTRRLGSLLVAMAVAVTVLGTVPARAEESAPAPVQESTIDTHFYKLSVRAYQLSSPVPWVAALPSGRILGLGPDQGLTTSPTLGGTVTAYPLIEFDPQAGTERSLGNIELAPLVGPGARVRMLDFQFFPQLQGRSTPARASVLLSVAASGSGCRRTYVQEVLVDLSGSGDNRLGTRWFTFPCIKPVNLPDSTTVGPVLHQSGGRIALVPRNQWSKAAVPELYFTTGDFQLVKTHARQLPAKTLALMGAILRVPERGDVEVLASGLRNPQGLATATLDGKPALMATSHGPRGGDELVRVEPGADYGWPRESYGTVYDYKPTPVQSKPKVEGALPSATLPDFAWVPSIGPSALLQVRGPAFKQWWGATRGRPDADLLISGMGTKSLYRVRWQGGAVRYVESMPTGFRIRSLVQMSDGALMAGTDSGQILHIRPVSQWSSSASAFQ